MDKESKGNVSEERSKSDNLENAGRDEDNAEPDHHRVVVQVAAHDLRFEEKKVDNQSSRSNKQTTKHDVMKMLLYHMHLC